MIVVDTVVDGPAGLVVVLDGDVEHRAGEHEHADRVAAAVIDALGDHDLRCRQVDLDVAFLERSDLATIEQLARIVLAVHRSGSRARIIHAPARLGLALDLAGLTGLTTGTA